MTWMTRCAAVTCRLLSRGTDPRAPALRAWTLPLAGTVAAVSGMACPADPRPPSSAEAAVSVDGAEPQDTAIPTGDAADTARPQIVGLTAPSSVVPGQIVTLRIVTDYPNPDEITGIALVIEGVENWLLAEADPVPGTITDAGAWVVTVPITVAESFSEQAVARVSVALLGPNMGAGAYRNWVPTLDAEAEPVACPADAECTALQCGADPICSTDCGACTPEQACNAAGGCEMIGDACPDAADCTDRVCGFDPICGSVCGECGPGESCTEDASQCVSGQSKVVASIAQGPTREHNCAVLDDASVICWGRNDAAQLGLGDLDSRGDMANELGENLAATDLGVGAKRLAAGEGHTCALTEDDEIVCWGEGDAGALGRGDVLTIGDQPGELPSDLVAVDLPLGTIDDLCVGDQFGCALDDGGDVACWGRNDFGQLGQGDTQDRGDGADELGSNLSALDLDGSASEIHCGRAHACARVGSELKCWGRNDWGQLGVGDTNHRGDEPDEMGANLPSVPFGEGRNPRLSAMGSNHACVVLDDDSLKCWGQGYWGAIGLESQGDFGDSPASTPDLLPTVDLGVDAEVLELSAGDRHTCARIEGEGVRCWGYPWALGVGDAEGRGATPNTMGENLERAFLSGLPLTSLSAAGDFSCAQTENGRVQCWGFNLYGQLGAGDTQTRGDEPGEMGSALPFVPL